MFLYIQFEAAKIRSGSILALKILDEVHKNAKCDEYEE